MVIRTAFLFLFCCGFVTGQSVNVDDIKASGKFTTNHYENGDLGISIELPKGWLGYDEETNKKTLDKGHELIRQDKSKAAAKRIDESISKTRVLFQVSPAAGGAGISVGIESVPAGISSRQYAESNVSMLRGVPNVKLTKDIYQKSLGNKPWETFDVEMRVNGVTVKQQYFNRVQNGVALFFIATIVNSIFEKDVSDSLSSIKFVR